MHGRLKIKTTAQQEEEKKKEKQKKLLIYNAGIQKAQSKRLQQEYDNEALELTSQLLLANPDFYTMWNFRKEIILFWKKQKEAEEFNLIMTNEIGFTESCLKVNPKSYGSWYHRLWVLKEMPYPNWQKELQLCNRYLELDERNFHCWDYRFQIANFCQVTEEEELKFSDAKILSNFSNYSSWHYRSKLLPKTYPDPDKLRQIKEEKLMQEFELVQNAAFTDPDDPSVWFYHQWLLGQGERQNRPKYFYCDRQTLILVFTGFNIKSDIDSKVAITIQGIKETLNWFSPLGFENGSALWISKLNLIVGPLDVNVKINWSEEKLFELSCLLGETDQEKFTAFDNAENNYVNQNPLSEATKSVLQHELDSVNQLLELEPKSKWPLLTSVLLMRRLNFSPYKELIFDRLDLLKEVDALRLGYYQDLKSKFIIEIICESEFMVEPLLNLSDMKLTKLYHTEYLFGYKTIDLSRNCLKCLSGINLFVCVEELNLNENELTSCKCLEGLLLLKRLSLLSNKISTLDAFLPLKHCPSITCLDARYNEVCDIPDYINYVKSLLPHLSLLDGSEV